MSVAPNCRCTGYRPILDAFKAFGSDAPKSRLAEVVGDIEELGGAGGAVCHRTGAPCPGAGRCAVAEPGCHTSPDTGSTTWYHPSTTAELAATLAGLAPSHKYRIVGGNTGTGVFKHEEEFYQVLNFLYHDLYLVPYISKLFLFCCLRPRSTSTASRSCEQPACIR